VLKGEIEKKIQLKKEQKIISQPDQATKLATWVMRP
jgi:hypothetical protein